MIKKTISFEEFEKSVMQKILEKNTFINVILRDQYKKAFVEKRIFTGVGFFTDFEVPENVPRLIEPIEYAYGDVEAIINNISGFQFILFIKDGVIKSLEGYTWRDSWPNTIKNYTLICKEK